MLGIYFFWAFGNVWPQILQHCSRLVCLKSTLRLFIKQIILVGKKVFELIGASYGFSHFLLTLRFILTVIFAKKLIFQNLKLSFEYLIFLGDLFLFGYRIDFRIKNLIFELMSFHSEKFSLPESILIDQQCMSLF
jgi:hypothetical protein